MGLRVDLPFVGWKSGETTEVVLTSDAKACMCSSVWLLCRCSGGCDCRFCYQAAMHELSCPREELQTGTAGMGNGVHLWLPLAEG